MEARKALLAMVLALVCCSSWKQSALAAISRPIGRTPSEEDGILTNLLSSKAYTKDDPPNLESTTEVQIGIYIYSFNGISEQSMDFALSIILRQTWKDPRLIYDKRAQPMDKVITLDEMHWSKLWVPDTFFRNEKQANLHDVTLPNRFITLNTTDGAVWYGLKVTTVLSCMMQLHKFPMDTQHCPMTLESFGYKLDRVNMTWLPQPVQQESGITIPQFHFVDYTKSNCSRNQSVSHQGSCLELLFEFRRDVGFYVIQVFVPSILIVSLSWVSFWINVDAAPARVSLGLLTVLTTTNYSISINANLPRVSYVKAIDVWMSACLLFVFSALCEYAFVNVASRHKPTLRQPVPARSVERPVSRIEESTSICIPQHGGRVPPLALAPPPPTCKPPKPPDAADGKARAQRIDELSRRCFPSVFVVFNIVYWLLYLFTDSKMGS